MATRIKLNSAGVRALLRSAEMEAALRPSAEKVLANARAGAPVDQAAEHPGEYRDSLQIIPDPSSKRARLAVGSDVPFARKVEMEHGVLGNAL